VFEIIKPYSGLQSTSTDGEISVLDLPEGGCEGKFVLSVEVPEYKKVLVNAYGMLTADEWDA